MGTTKRSRLTIKDIAQEAGVSISTVSNVLNGNITEMSEDTLLRVQQVIRRLNYRPNQIARGLVTRRTATIGLILTEIETPLFLQALTSIERGARADGYSVLLMHARDEREEQEAIELLREKQVEGIIFLSTSEIRDDAHLELLKSAQIATVLINRASHHRYFDRVNWDNETGLYEAVKYLAGLGHERIAFLHGPDQRSGTQDRLTGYRRALRDLNIRYRDEYIENGDYTKSLELWRESTHSLINLPHPPTAILAADDTVAAVVVETLRLAGLAVPEDISVIGIDDQPFLSFLSLTTIRLPIVEAGKTAIEPLIRRLAEPDWELRHVTWPCPVIQRNSTGRVRQA